MEVGSVGYDEFCFWFIEFEEMVKILRSNVWWMVGNNGFECEWWVRGGGRS